MRKPRNYKSRKFILASAITGISSIALFYGYLTGNQFVSVISIIGSTYLAVNTISQHKSFQSSITGVVDEVKTKVEELKVKGSPK